MTNSYAFAVAAIVAALAAGPAMAQQKEHRLTVANDTDQAIEYFYFASCGAGEWGQDRLGNKEIIKPGARKVFSIRSASEHCCYDLRAKLQTGASRQKVNADICGGFEWMVR